MSRKFLYNSAHVHWQQQLRANLAAFSGGCEAVSKHRLLSGIADGFIEFLLLQYSCRRIPSCCNAV